METMKLGAVQHPGHAGQLLDSFIRHAENLPCDSHRLAHGTWVRVRQDSWQRCNE